MAKNGKKASWTITPWVMDRGRWVQQPVILVEGKEPFLADHPTAYISKLQELHDDPTMGRGGFFTLMGQLQDCLEQIWNREATHAGRSHKNGHRSG